MPVTALLFDAQGHDTKLDLSGGWPAVGDQQLLWVDVQADENETLDALLAPLKLDEPSRAALHSPGAQPTLHRQEHQVALSVNAIEKDVHHYRGVPVGIVAGQNLVVTAHEGPVSFLESFRGQLESDTQLGRLDAAAFLAVLLNHHVEGYYALLAPLEANVDRLDEAILGDPRGGRRHLETLVGLRRRVSELRRRLGAHRAVYAGLASPDFAVFAGDQPEAMLGRLFRQFERAQDAVGHTREMVLGSFDLLMSSTGQRTNEIMRVLTVVTVTLGIIAAVAGLMGMNFEADIFKAGNTGFRDVLLFSGGLIVVITALGRWRGWL